MESRGTFAISHGVTRAAFSPIGFAKSKECTKTFEEYTLESVLDNLASPHPKSATVKRISALIPPFCDFILLVASDLHSLIIASNGFEGQDSTCLRYPS
jgi:hypothetical protein